MDKRCFLVLDSEDSGSEHGSWEEAKTVLDDLRKRQYLPDARIIPAAAKAEYSDDLDHPSLLDS